jgi:hypothetical protein
VGVEVSAGVAPAMICPADPFKSSVVLVEVPPIFNVEFGLVIVSPPPLAAAHEHTAGLAAVHDRYVLLPLGCAAGISIA